jgi:uncharacterized protein (DUF2147 family)
MQKSLVFIFALCALVLAGAARADPAGLWLTRDGSKVRVGACGGMLCGTLVSVEPPNDPATGRPWTDKNNPDEARRGRPLVGLVVFISMKPDGPMKWAGQLYNADNGETISGHLIEIDNQTIRAEGCSGPLCGGENLSRIK